MPDPPQVTQVALARESQPLGGGDAGAEQQPPALTLGDLQEDIPHPPRGVQRTDPHLAEEGGLQEPAPRLLDLRGAPQVTRPDGQLVADQAGPSVPVPPDQHLPVPHLLSLDDAPDQGRLGGVLGQVLGGADHHVHAAPLAVQRPQPVQHPFDLRSLQGLADQGSGQLPDLVGVHAEIAPHLHVSDVGPRPLADPKGDQATLQRADPPDDALDRIPIDLHPQVPHGLVACPQIVLGQVEGRLGDPEAPQRRGPVGPAGKALDHHQPDLALGEDIAPENADVPLVGQHGLGPGVDPEDQPPLSVDLLDLAGDLDRVVSPLPVVVLDPVHGVLEVPGVDPVLPLDADHGPQSAGGHTARGQDLIRLRPLRVRRLPELHHRGGARQDVERGRRRARSRVQLQGRREETRLQVPPLAVQFLEILLGLVHGVLAQPSPLHGRGADAHPQGPGGQAGRLVEADLGQPVRGPWVHLQHHADLLLPHGFVARRDPGVHESLADQQVDQRLPETHLVAFEEGFPLAQGKRLADHGPGHGRGQPPEGDPPERRAGFQVEGHDEPHPVGDDRDAHLTEQSQPVQQLDGPPHVPRTKFLAGGQLHQVRQLLHLHRRRGVEADLVDDETGVGGRTPAGRSRETDQQRERQRDQSASTTHRMSREKSPTSPRGLRVPRVFWGRR